jgi:hypothetical protein
MNHLTDQEYDVEIENLRLVPHIEGPWFENIFMCDMFRIKYEDTSVKLRSDWSDVINHIKPDNWITLFNMQMKNEKGNPISITFAVTPIKVKKDYMYFNVKRWAIFDPVKSRQEILEEDDE